jgi:RNA polymerase sigma-70 factor, ECF subfamily
MRTDVSDHIVSTQRRVALGKGSCLITAQDRLLLRMRRGEEEAFNELVTQQHHLLIRIAMRYVASRDVAEEVVQETWIAVFSSIDRFEGRSSLRAWICGILIHKAKDRGVREQRSRPFSDFEFDDDRSGDAIGLSRSGWYRDFSGHRSFSRQLWDKRTPEKLLLSKQAMDCMQRAIDALPRTLKEVLIIRDVDGLETNEVCARLNLTETNFYVRLHRARQQVRMTLETTLG